MIRAPRDQDRDDDRFYATDATADRDMMTALVADPDDMPERPATATERALRAEIAELTAQRNALAQVLRTVPVHAHNEAVILSDCNLLDYTHAMEQAS